MVEQMRQKILKSLTLYHEGLHFSIRFSYPNISLIRTPLDPNVFAKPTSYFLLLLIIHCLKASSSFINNFSVDVDFKFMYEVAHDKCLNVLGKTLKKSLRRFPLKFI